MKKRSASKSAPKKTSPKKTTTKRARAAAKAPKKSGSESDEPHAPTIVGVGASAGGLEAFVSLLHGLSPDTGLAYVLVQHLARDHESVLPELLARHAPIPVVQARNGMRIDPNHAYVIPPDATMTVSDGHLRLVRRDKGRGLHLPIDAFLTSLAEVHGEHAIGVILSGAGSDGARGVEAIKERGGITFAQDTGTAKHPSMPEAAVGTGSVDFVLSPESIAQELVHIAHHVARSGNGAEPDADAQASRDEEDFLAILKLLHRRTDVDFSQYRRATVHRRVLRRMLVHRKSTQGDYLLHLRRDPVELDRLYDDLLIGVTSFFRDPEVFAELRTSVFPELMRTRVPDTPFRVWIAGCSGGEETYSLAIALLEYLEDENLDVPIQMFGTDLSEASVARARAGLYPASIADRVSPERLRKFFTHEQGSYRIAKHVRDRCVFSRHNLVRDPPFSHLDLISCRNVLIYFETGLQRRVFPILHYALEPHGMLLLGNAESPGPSSPLFQPFIKRHKIYRRSSAPARTLELDFVSQRTPELRLAAEAKLRVATSGAVSPDATSALAMDLDRAVLDQFGRRGVVINERMEIVHFRGDTSGFLAHGSGTATLDLLQLAREELVIPLRVLVSRATSENRPAVERHVTLVEGDETRQITIEVLPLARGASASKWFLVLFTREEAGDVVAAKHGKRGRGRTAGVSRTAKNELATLRGELANAKSYLAEIIEQREATIEELRAASEEIQSSNEELQSTNEELETTKEEVQSTNEELTTLNEELRHRNRELGEVASDVANVFASTAIPIVIVGRDLRVRRFTPATAQLFRIIGSDVGRAIGDIKPNFALGNFEELILATIDSLSPSEHLIRDNNGAWWMLNVRPYQTLDRRVDGAVLVFNDVDAAKRSEIVQAEVSEGRRVALVGAEHERSAALLRTNQALAAGLADRERAESERNVLLRQLDLAQEDERRRLSRELHDEAGQHLTALALGLQALADVAPPGSEIDRRVEQLAALSDTLGRELHGLALRLRPRALDDFGLDAAIESYAQELATSSGIATEVHADGVGERLPPPVESAAYRVVQEALTNVARHSGATHASVVVKRRDGHLHVIVEDNGRGFDVSTLSRSAGERGGLGLLGIRERIALLGGSVDIESAEGQGTTLFLRIPVSAPQ